MVVFAVLGAIDRIIGNKIGLGQQFEEGILAIGTLALSMVGIIALSPVIAKVLQPVIVPLFHFLGADPAMFAGSILANDMGGAPLAAELAATKEAAQFGGLIVGSMLGPTIVFTIPVALGIIKESDRKYLATGVLAGVITIPFGSFFGGLAAGFPIKMILMNLIPIVLFAILIALGLWKFENGMIKGFTVFGKCIVVIITIGLAAGIVEALTGIKLIPGMNPLSDGFEIVADIRNKLNEQQNWSNNGYCRCDCQQTIAERLLKARKSKILAGHAEIQERCIWSTRNVQCRHKYRSCIPDKQGKNRAACD